MFIVSVSFMQIVMRSSGFFCDSHVRTTVLVVVSKGLNYHSTGSHLACVLRVALCANVL